MITYWVFWKCIEYEEKGIDYYENVLSIVRMYWVFREFMDVVKMYWAFSNREFTALRMHTIKCYLNRQPNLSSNNEHARDCVPDCYI